jgi:hypothetical protein
VQVSCGYEASLEWREAESWGDIGLFLLLHFLFFIFFIFYKLRLNSNKTKWVVGQQGGWT